MGAGHVAAAHVPELLRPLESGGLFIVVILHFMKNALETLGRVVHAVDDDDEQAAGFERTQQLGHVCGADVSGAHRADANTDRITTIPQRQWRRQISANQTAINPLGARLREHAGRNVKAVDPIEAQIGERRADQAGTATVVDDALIPRAGLLRQRLCRDAG